MITLADKAEMALRMVREAPIIAYDTETSGLDWRRHSVVGYVITASQEANVYIPVRHGGGGNLGDPNCGPLVEPTDVSHLHLFEIELQKAFFERRQRKLLTVGHNLKFDLHMSAKHGVYLGRDLEDTQINEALLNEFSRSFSLDSCAKVHGVTAKLGEEMYAHLAKVLGGPADKTQMAHFWRLAGNDPVAVDYAMGDGITTLELRAAQIAKISEQKLDYIHGVESQLIWTVFRMEHKGIKIDIDRAGQIKEEIASRLKDAMALLPAGFNVRSSPQVKKLVEEAGHLDWPKTEKQNPSFTEKWLKGFPEGRAIISVRQLSNLGNTFLTPLIETHIYKGRVYSSLNQMRADEHGTISGRFSSSAPNMQQCLAAGTKVMIPGGEKNIENIEPGDWVYSFNDDLKLTLKKVTWSGQTGVRSLVRVNWVGDPNSTAPKGFVDVTNDHPIRLVTGEYIKAGDLRGGKLKHDTHSNRASFGKMFYSGGERVLSLHRLITCRDAKSRKVRRERNLLHATGRSSIQESMFVFEQINGWLPQEVHHADENSLNDSPNNLEGMTKVEHSAHHSAMGRAAREKYENRFTKQQLIDALNEGKSVHRASKILGCYHGAVTQRMNEWSIPNPRVANNHRITHIEMLPGEHPVYDITVDGTENFIANEICVHNCPKRNKDLGSLFRSIFIPDEGMEFFEADYSQAEPRLFAHYSRDAALVEGYNQKPFKDMHAVVAELMNVERDPTAKRMGMGILTTMQPRTLADHMQWDVPKATEMYNKFMGIFKGIGEFQQQAKNVFRSRGYVRTLLGRVCRLDDPRFAYRGTSRIIQGGSADLVKKKLLDMDIYLEESGYDDTLNLLMTIHDSFEGQNTKDDKGRAARAEIIRMMEDVQSEPFNLRVPFVAELGVGPNWSIATYGEGKTNE